MSGIETPNHIHAATECPRGAIQENMDQDKFRVIHHLYQRQTVRSAGHGDTTSSAALRRVQSRDPSVVNVASIIGAGNAQDWHRGEKH